MPRPPRDPDDLSEVMGQVVEALDDIDFVHAADREALIGSLRDALGALGNLPLESIEIRTVEFGPDIPVVRVIDGGRGDESAVPVTSKRPALRLAPQDDTEGAPRRNRPPRHRVRKDVIPEPTGDIRLSPSEGGDATQTLYFGTTRRTHRVRCVAGRFDVEVDGAWVCSLAAGQTVDVEATQLQVCAAEPSEGRYMRLAT